MNIPVVRTIIEPFAGNGDLLSFIPPGADYQIECYDIDPKKENITQRDTLLDPPDYGGKFVLTNPPYLARNKNGDKVLYDKYGCNDLYKCFMISLMGCGCLGGILIIPLNFLCSIRKNDIDLRKKFIGEFRIMVVNIFEEQVFSDTSYAVCSIQFERRTAGEAPIECFIYPYGKRISMDLTETNNYTIGGEIYKLHTNPAYKIERATRATKDLNCITNILLKCIDDSIDSKIQLKIVKKKDRYIDDTPNLSGRSYASLVITPQISETQQKDLVDKFNAFLESNREKYNSLFLTNYRESNTIARKRISFELAFQICSHLLL